MRARVTRHARKFKKGTLTHFSLFEVWDNVTEAEVRELEGLLRHIFRGNPAALGENRQRGFGKLRRVHVNDLSKWRDAVNR
jgi:hypothetical protein